MENFSSEEIARCPNPECGVPIFRNHQFAWCAKCWNWLPHEIREQLPGVLENYGEPSEPDPEDVPAGVFPFPENASAGTFNGIGTTLYGYADPLPDRSYIATKWFVLFWIPLFPLASFRIIDKESPVGIPSLVGRKSTYDATQVPLNKKQIKKTYLITVPIILAIISLILLVF